MSVQPPPGAALRFNPPPNWPVPPQGWTPPPGWAPDPSWPSPPEGWQLWIVDAAAARTRPGADMGVDAHQLPGRRQGWRAKWQSWPTSYKVLGALVAVLILIGVVAIAATSSSTPPYVSQLEHDGYSLVRQGTLTGGEGVGYAYGDNATGAGELVLEGRTAADAQATANGMQQDGFDVTTQGDLLIIQASSYSDIQSLANGAGW